MIRHDLSWKAGWRWLTLPATALLILTAVPRLAFAGKFVDYCRTFLSGGLKAAPVNDLLIDHLPLLSKFDLPSNVKTHLRRTASPALQRTLRGMDISLIGYDAALNLHPAAIGEGLQAFFMAQFIKAVEPKARIFSEQDAPTGARHFSLHDPWQSTQPPDGARISSRFPAGNWQELIGYHSFAMPLLKASNALYASLPRRSILRRQLGLDPELKILSLYLFRANYESPEFENFLTEIRRVFPYDVLFISDSRDRSFLGMAPAEPSGMAVHRLSRIKLEELRTRTPGGTIVVNDRIGRTPVLHALANLAMVRGPVDFLGPLQSGTPLLAIKDDSSLRRFHRAGYAQMQDLAESTGAALFTDDLTTLDPQQVAALARLEEFWRPYQIPVIEGHTPIDLLRQALELHLTP